MLKSFLPSDTEGAEFFISIVTHIHTHICLSMLHLGTSSSWVILQQTK